VTEIRMIQQMSGPRHDGQQWPAPYSQGGGTIDVTPNEARDLVNAGIAERVPKARKGDDEETGDQVTAVETRAPVGLTQDNTPVTRVRGARAAK
jgi:hypothetical protein